MAPAGGLALEGAGQLHELPDATASALRGRFLAAHAGVLLARGQRPASEQGLFLAKRVAGLGAFVRTSQGAVQPYAAQGRRGTPEAELPRGSDFWHQDNSYLASPARFTALYATDEVPAGEGDTLFANLVAAWDALEEPVRQAARRLECWHCHAHNGGEPHPQHQRGPLLPAQRHPLVHRHPVTGREALFLSPCYLRGPDVPDGPARAEAAGLLRELLEHALRPEFVFRHRWSPGDLLIWDNHVVMHRATTIDMSAESKRVMFRMCFGD